jgi:hypothetical protein
MTFDPKEEDVLPRRHHLLTTVYTQLRADPTRVCCGMDCSIPKQTSHQATASFIIEQAGSETLASTWVVGRVLSADVELFMIRTQGGNAGRLPSHHHLYRLHSCSQTSSRPVSPLRTDTFPCDMQGPHLVVCPITGPLDGVYYHPVQAGEGHSICGSLLHAQSPSHSGEKEGDLPHCWMACENT